MDGANFVVVDPSKSIQTSPSVIDWTLCVLCQKDVGSKLVVPSQNNSADKFKGYLKLEKSLQLFDEAGVLNSLPFSVNLRLLCDQNGIYDTLKKNNAVYHKVCQLYCSERELERAVKRKNKEVKSYTSSPVKTRRLSSGFDQSKCLFCDKIATRKQSLCNVATENNSLRIKKYAVLLKDTVLMAKVSGAHDLMAMEASYHCACLTAFNNRIRKYDNRVESESQGCSLPPRLSELHAYGLANLVSHVDNVREATSDGLPIFKMTDLAKCYNNYMKDMGVDHVAHTSRLRDRLLNACPYLQSSGTAGQEILITYQSDYNVSLRAAARNFDTDAFQFADVAKIIRSDIFCQEETGGWEEMLEKQSESTPLSLKALLKMIMRGPGSFASSTEEEADFDQVVNSLAQLISYHAVKRVSKTTTTRRHASAREKPVPVYLAMKIYGETRSKSLINLTHQLGLSISYNRLQTVLTEKASAVCARYSASNVVCPPVLHRGDFTIGAVDNIDHDTSSYTAKTAFHGTAISLMQFPNVDAPGVPQDALFSEHHSASKIIDLPDNYAIVKPSFLNIKTVKIPPAEQCSVAVTEEASPMQLEKEWLENYNDSSFLPWPVFNSRAENIDLNRCLTRTAVLPLFSEQAHSVAMMAHAMDSVSSAIHYISPGQTPVLVADQPLYALCRSIQCVKPDSYGEDNIFIMLGSLHIEMASLRALGTLLENSGWVGALVHAEVSTQGRAESMLRATHVTRTRYAHEVTVAVLHYLQQTAYDSYKQHNDDAPVALSFDEWYHERCKTVPQFKYWDLVMRLELTVLQLVASLRSANFDTYKQSLANLVGWFFALDQVNYARWLSVHIRDLVNLDTKHPHLAQKFREGCFVARKTHRPFSAIGLDQNHEQVNATLKGNGGMIGLTEKSDSMAKLLLTIPELASMISKFETKNFEPTEDVSVHHSDSNSFISLFRRDYESLKATFLEWGNPFLEDGPDLYNIETNVKAPQKSSENVQNIQRIGQSQYKSFVRERLESAQKLVTDPIPQNKISIWSGKGKGLSKVQKEAAKLRGLKSDCELFRKLFIACQVRQYDLDDFFRYENQAWPPSLSLLGRIRCIGKSDILKCLITPVKSSIHLPGVPLPAFEAKVYDGPAIVHMLPPGPVRTFQDYADKVFCPYIIRECTPGVKRIDVVWDTYCDKSLKNATREKRGHGERFVVNPFTKVPKSWPNFLRDSHNKVQLFKLLAASVQLLNVPGVEFYSTVETSAISSSPVADLSFISPCNHEEADSRLILHVADAAKKGLQTCMVRTTDSDVFVLAVAYAHQIKNLQSLWVSIGVGKNHLLVNASDVSNFLGPEKSKALPLFHAFSGCDTVSSFLSKGKKSASETWAASPEATEGFLALRRGDVDKSLPTLERFVITLYDKCSKSTTVNECRRELFTRKGRAPENLPPSQDALRQHCLRAAYQGGHVWGQCLVAQQKLPDPSLWGWVQCDDENLYWAPKWTTLGQIQNSLLVLMKCGCKNGCTNRCKCRKALLPCTEMCECCGDCEEEPDI